MSNNEWVRDLANEHLGGGLHDDDVITRTAVVLKSRELPVREIWDGLYDKLKTILDDDNGINAIELHYGVLEDEEDE